MLTFPTTGLFVEGPDCSGKTTLVKNIHELSNYSWHINDRSQISRNIFSKLYNRHGENYDTDLHTEISNLNNRFMLLLPDINVVADRFNTRGDDFHKSIESINEVYYAFQKKFENIKNLPNVRTYRRNDTHEIASLACATLHLMERCMIREVSDQVEEFVGCNMNESYPLSFTLYDSGEFEEADATILDYIPEKDYYKGIFKKLHDTIDDECLGKNSYNRIEDHRSRRFVYTDNTCISFIQVSVRDGVMDFHTVIRSTDVKNIFPYDLKFLYYLASTCYDKFKDHCDRVRMRFNLNSAHIIG
jgi:hypothetical protein